MDSLSLKKTLEEYRVSSNLFHMGLNQNQFRVRNKDGRIQNDLNVKYATETSKFRFESNSLGP